MKTIRCKVCLKEFKVPNYRGSTAIYCSRSCLAKDKTGERNPFYGKKHSDKTKTQISNTKTGTQSGEKNPFYGKKHSEETKQKIRESRQKQVNDPEYMKNYIEGRKQMWKNPDYRERKIESLKNMAVTEETRQKMSEAHSGERNINYGKPVSEERKMKQSEAMQGKYDGIKNPMYGKTGENAPAWMGGISFEPYPVDFNGNFKERVREFFGRVCQVCGKHESECNAKLDVHHYDYDKTSFNVVPVCMSCHGLTNWNRDSWQKYFEDLINNNYNGKCYYTQEEYIQLQQQKQ